MRLSGPFRPGSAYTEILFRYLSDPDGLLRGQLVVLPSTSASARTASRSLVRGVRAGLDR